MDKIDYRDYLGDYLDGGAIRSEAFDIDCLHKALEMAESDEDRKMIKKKIKFSEKRLWLFVMLKRHFGIVFPNN